MLSPVALDGANNKLQNEEEERKLLFFLSGRSAWLKALLDDTGLLRVLVVCFPFASAQPTLLEVLCEVFKFPLQRFARVCCLWCFCIIRKTGVDCFSCGCQAYTLGQCV